MRYVVLEHVWNGVHWDLMLEADGVLRTWAVDQPIVAGRELSARALPDHRLHYLEYEGEISGGRGSVRRVDQGRYESRLWTPDLIQIHLNGAQVSGVDLVLKRETGLTLSPRSWLLRLGNLD